jgi:hypothetical protein
MEEPIIEEPEIGSGDTAQGNAPAQDTGETQDPSQNSGTGVPVQEPEAGTGAGTDTHEPETGTEPPQETGQELEHVYPEKFELHIAGRTRTIKFGNLALAKIEKRYGSVTNFGKLQTDMEQHPMETIPGLLSICMRDKEGITDTVDGILSAMDDSDLSISEVTVVLSQAMESALSNFMGGADAEKKRKKS